MQAAPSIGAQIGATPITKTSFDISFAAAGPSAKSRTVARGITNPAEAPSAVKNLKKTKDSVFQLATHPNEANMYNTNPESSGLRRPIRSDSAPQVICPQASPKK